MLLTLAGSLHNVGTSGVAEMPKLIAKIVGAVF